MLIEQVKEILSSINGTTFCSMDTITPVALKGGKKNPMQGRVTKVTKNNRIILFSNKESNGYENMVNRRLAKEGKEPNFKVGPLPWGQRIPGTPFIEHKGETYLQCCFNKGGVSEYFLDNKPIAKEDIEGFPEPKETPEGENSTGKQGLEDENAVVLRTFKLSNIREMRVLGEVIHG